MKFQRQAKILDIIEKNNIETQEELASQLRLVGIEATQATISRDIRELRLVKVMSGATGSHKYALPTASGDSGFTSRLRTIFKESVTKIDAAQNIVVIKTLPGLAPAACAAIDSMNLSYIVGTLAGDDTAFMVMQDQLKANTFVEEIKVIFE